MFLKQSTTVNIKLGPFLDKTDGVTEETALSPTVQISKNGGAFANRNSTTTITHDANGWYLVELDATDTNTLGRLQIKVHDSATHLPVWAEYMVLPANIYDSLVGNSDKLQVDTVQVSGTTQTARDLGANIDATISSRSTFDPTTDTVANVTTVGSVTNRVTANSDQINGNATAAARLADAAQTIEIGQAVAGTLTTTQFSTDLTETTDDHYKNRTVIWTSGNLIKQQATISAYDGTNKIITVLSPMTEAPAAGDTFIIV